MYIINHSPSVTKTGLCVSYFPLHEEVDGDHLCASLSPRDHASQVNSQSKNSLQLEKQSFCSQVFIECDFVIIAHGRLFLVG